MVKRAAYKLRKRFLRWSRPRRELSREAYSLLADYHIHTRLCGHARGEPDEYVKEALSKGLSQIGFSDHMPLIGRRDDRLTMALDDLPHYVEIVRELQSSVDELTIRLGIEVDYVPGEMDEVWAEISKYDFDYILGGIHHIDGWGFVDSRNVSSYKGRDPDEMYARYFELFCEAAEHGGFDAIAHPDVIKKHGFKPGRAIDHMYEAAAEALRQGNTCVEINTSGLRKRTLELYPSIPFLRACAEHQVPATLGSDAHAPWEVGMDFDRALRLLRRVGIEEIALFESRKRTLTKI